MKLIHSVTSWNDQWLTNSCH